MYSGPAFFHNGGEHHFRETVNGWKKFLWTVNSILKSFLWIVNDKSCEIWMLRFRDYETVNREWLRDAPKLSRLNATVRSVRLGGRGSKGLYDLKRQNRDFIDVSHRCSHRSRVWTKLKKMPISNSPYRKLHAEQESEVHFCLSVVLSLHIDVL